MTFRPYTGKIRLGNSPVFLNIGDIPDGYVLARGAGDTRGEIVAKLIGQGNLSLGEPQNPGDAATKSYVDTAIANIDPAGAIGDIQFNLDGYSFGANSNLAWNNSTNTLSVTGEVAVDGRLSLAEVQNLPSGEAGRGQLAVKQDKYLYFVDSDGYSHHIMPDGLITLSGTSVVLDADPGFPIYRTLTLTDTTTFTTANLGNGRGISLRLVPGASNRGVVFPSDWKWLGGSAPVSVQANKVAIVSIVSYGSTDADVVAGWSYSDSEVVTGSGNAGEISFFGTSPTGRTIRGTANLKWDTTTGSLMVGSVATPSASLHVANTVQVDGYATFNEVVTFNEAPSVGGNKIVNLATPTADTDAANKQYVENRRLLSIQTISSAATPVASDKDIVFITGSGGTVVRLPLAVESNSGKTIVFKKKNSGSKDSIATATGSGQSIDGVVAETSNYYDLFLQNETVMFVSDGYNWFVL